MKKIFKSYKKYVIRKNPLYKEIPPRFIHNTVESRYKEIESFSSSEIEVLSKLLNVSINIPEKTDQYLYITKKGSYLTLYKMPDEWYYAESGDFKHDYKCDTMEGVIQLICDYKLDKL